MGRVADPRQQRDRGQRKERKPHVALVEPHAHHVEPRSELMADHAEHATHPGRDGRRWQTANRPGPPGRSSGVAQREGLRRRLAVCTRKGLSGSWAVTLSVIRSAARRPAGTGIDPEGPSKTRRVVQQPARCTATATVTAAGRRRTTRQRARPPAAEATTRRMAPWRTSRASTAAGATAPPASVRVAGMPPGPQVAPGRAQAQGRTGADRPRPDPHHPGVQVPPERPQPDLGSARASVRGDPHLTGTVERHAHGPRRAAPGRPRLAQAAAERRRGLGGAEPPGADAPHHADADPGPTPGRGRDVGRGPVDPGDEAAPGPAPAGDDAHAAPVPDRQLPGARAAGGEGHRVARAPRAGSPWSAPRRPRAPACRGCRSPDCRSGRRPAPGPGARARRSPARCVPRPPGGRRGRPAGPLSAWPMSGLGSPCRSPDHHAVGVRSVIWSWLSSMTVGEVPPRLSGCGRSECG